MGVTEVPFSYRSLSSLGLPHFTGNSHISISIWKLHDNTFNGDDPHYEFH